MIWESEERPLRLIVFYVGNILVDKNTLCNNFILNRFIAFIQCL